MRPTRRGLRAIWWSMIPVRLFRDHASRSERQLTRSARICRPRYPASASCSAAGGSWTADHAAELERVDRCGAGSCARQGQRGRDRHAPVSTGSTPTAPGCSNGWCATARGAGRATPVVGVCRITIAGLLDEVHAASTSGAWAAAHAMSRSSASLESIGRACRRRVRRHHQRVRCRCLARPRSPCCASLVRPRALPLHLDGASPRPGRLAGGADHPADHVPDRRDHRAAGHLPFPQVRRRHLRRRHGRHPGAARDRRPDRRRSWWRAARAAPTRPSSAR